MFQRRIVLTKRVWWFFTHELQLNPAGILALERLSGNRTRIQSYTRSLTVLESIETIQDRIEATHREERASFANMTSSAGARR